ncbi:hypothetical protein J6590_031488 [Homalodisca vitripennis]|nr:hypothetical protein J6590_031488 [Homalodisca vitripennis]
MVHFWPVHTFQWNLQLASLDMTACHLLPALTREAAIELVSSSSERTCLRLMTKILPHGSRQEAAPTSTLSIHNILSLQKQRKVLLGLSAISQLLFLHYTRISKEQHQYMV